MNQTTGGQVQNPRLRRELGVFAAMMMGLGSIVGTGVFVSIGIAAGIAGPAVVLAIAVAAGVATCNGLSSAQLAANLPVSGGTYAYGYRYLNPMLGFTAGWMFLCAKSASAATAALGFAGYVLSAPGTGELRWQVPLALAAVIVLTGLVLCGIRRSSAANIAIVSVTLLSLVVFVFAGLSQAVAAGLTNFSPFFAASSEDAVRPLAGLLEACAMMFVAYTGYGRIATLGEEVRNPRRNIPMAIIITLIVSMLLYVSVAVVGVAAVGAKAFGTAGAVEAAPLAVIVQDFPLPGANLLLAVGAVTALLGVLLNLVLGLSRVVLAMARQREMPILFARLDKSETTPGPAVVLVGLVIAGLVLFGDVKTTWSFSAFTVLVYYAITNLCALRLQAGERLYPRWISTVGLLSCLFLAFWVEPKIWMAGLAMIAVGLVWHMVARSLNSESGDPG